MYGDTVQDEVTLNYQYEKPAAGPKDTQIKAKLYVPATTRDGTLTQQGWVTDTQGNTTVQYNIDDNKELSGLPVVIYLHGYGGQSLSLAQGISCDESGDSDATLSFFWKNFVIISPIIEEKDQEAIGCKGIYEKEGENILRR